MQLWVCIHVIVSKFSRKLSRYIQFGARQREKCNHGTGVVNVCNSLAIYSAGVGKLRIPRCITIKTHRGALTGGGRGLFWRPRNCGVNLVQLLVDEKFMLNPPSSNKGALQF